MVASEVTTGAMLDSLHELIAGSNRFFSHLNCSPEASIARRPRRLWDERLSHPDSWIKMKVRLGVDVLAAVICCAGAGVKLAASRARRCVLA